MVALFLFGCSAAPLRPSTNCGPSATMDGGVCVTPSYSPKYRIPFPSGASTIVSQAYYGAATHASEEPFAIDFSCSNGDPVVAARSGTVRDVVSHHVDGCSKARCRTTANYIVVDHGDGTYATYSHLAPNSTSVVRGDVVCEGDVIGACGQTGFTTGPHLHFSVSDAARRTFPVTFETDGGGMARRINVLSVGEVLVAPPERGGFCQKVGYSPLGGYAFAHQGIRLKRPLPLDVKRGDTLKIDGELVDPSLRRHRQREKMGLTWVQARNETQPWDAVAVHVAPVPEIQQNEPYRGFTTSGTPIIPDPEWTTICIGASMNGDFSKNIVVDETFGRSEPGTSEPTVPHPTVFHSTKLGSTKTTKYWIMLAPARKTASGCQTQGWAWAYQLFVDPP